MPPGSVELVREIIEALNRGDVEAMLARMDADFEWRPLKDSPVSRTYRGHERGEHPLRHPGSQDITCDVALDQLAVMHEPDAVRSQAQFLGLHGLDELVAEGRRVWAERASTADLAAVRARSRVREAEALTGELGARYKAWLDYLVCAVDADIAPVGADLCVLEMPEPWAAPPSGWPAHALTVTAGTTRDLLLDSPEVATTVRTLAGALA